MCEPMTWLMLAGAAVGVTQATIGAVQSIAAAEQEQAMLDFEQEQAEANKRMYEQQVQDIGEQGEWEKRNLALERRAALSSNQAAAAGSGVLLNYGSNLVMQEDASQTELTDMRQLEYDIASRQYQARLGVWQSENQIQALKAQQANARNQLPWTLISGGVSGLGNTLGLMSAGAQAGSAMSKAGWFSPTGGTAATPAQQGTMNVYSNYSAKTSWTGWNNAMRK